MASGEVLRHSVSIDEQEVFRLIHRPVELLELQPSQFTGRVASWADLRSVATATPSIPS